MDDVEFEEQDDEEDMIQLVVSVNILEYYLLVMNGRLKYFEKIFLQIFNKVLLLIWG